MRNVRSGPASALSTPSAASCCLSKLDLRIRVGIATGLVVVDDLIDRSTIEERMVVGDPLNLAARLQTIAEPNSVVIAETTRRLIGRLFDCTDLGGHELKGFSNPVRVWRVDGERAVESRFAALHDTGSTPLIGRETEFALLVNSLASVDDGRWSGSAAQRRARHRQVAHAVRILA